MHHHRKLINTMHKNGWSKEEIAESVKKLHKFRQQESKTVRIRKYLINILLILLSVTFSTLILVPILFLINKLTGILITIFFGLIIGTTLTNSVLSLEDFNDKHKTYSDIILFVVVLILGFAIFYLMFNFVGINSSAIYYSLSFAIGFAIPSAITKIHHFHETMKFQNHKKK